MQHATMDPDSRATPAGTSPRWPLPIVLLHWASAGLLLLGVAAVYGREAAEARWLRDALLNLHRWAGVLIWIACWLRLGLRLKLGLFGAGRTWPRSSAAWAAWAAAAAHAALYLLLLAVPLLGWALSSARGQPIAALGHGLPMILDRDPDLADTLAGAHSSAALALLGLIVLHALAAGWHHVVRRDGVLASMAVTRGLPRAISRSKTLAPEASPPALSSSPPAEPT